MSTAACWTGFLGPGAAVKGNGAAAKRSGQAQWPVRQVQPVRLCSSQCSQCSGEQCIQRSSQCSSQHSSQCRVQQSAQHSSQRKVQQSAQQLVQQSAQQLVQQPVQQPGQQAPPDPTTTDGAAAAGDITPRSGRMSTSSIQRRRVVTCYYGHTCIPVIVATLVSLSSWPHMYPCHRGHTCIPVIMTTHVSLSSWPHIYQQRFGGADESHRLSNRRGMSGDPISEALHHPVERVVFCRAVVLAVPSLTHDHIPPVSHPRMATYWPLCVMTNMSVATDMSMTNMP